MVSIRIGCKGCSSITTDSIVSDKNQRLYWMAANKDTTDFAILMSSLQETFVGSLTSTFPMTHHDKFDYYCTKCFLRLNKGRV